MIKYILFIGLGLWFFGCASGNCRSLKESGVKPGEEPTKTPQEIALMKETSVGQRVKVYKPDGTLQCNQGKKIAIDKMEVELKGLKVYSKYNKNDGKMRIQLCGSPTGNAHVFEIDRTDLEEALKRGFKEWTID